MNVFIALKHDKLFKIEVEEGNNSYQRHFFFELKKLIKNIKRIIW